MRIKTILSQYRRDMINLYECEHCGHEFTGAGYDDNFFHQTVVPGMVCSECGETAPDTYRPLSTKYDEGQQV